MWARMGWESRRRALGVVGLVGALAGGTSAYAAPPPTEVVVLNEVEAQDASVTGVRFQFADTAHIGDTNDVDLEVAIPAGKRLAVEQVSVRIDLPPSSDPLALWTVGWEDDDESMFHYLPVYAQGQDIFVGGQVVDFVAKGTLVIHVIGAHGGVVTATASGYLVDEPPGGALTPGG